MDKKGQVLITGSSGFIGSALARYLCLDYQVIGLDIERPSSQIEGVTYYTADFSSPQSLGDVLGEIKKNHGEEFFSVVHLVAYYSFDGKEDERYQSITLDGTSTLLKELKNHFIVKQFIFSSTMLVYAPVSRGEKINDNSPLLPSWPYPRSKIEAEKILERERGNISLVNLRIAGVYDDFCHAPSLANQIVRIFEKWVTSFPFPGNPSHGQSFLHLDDLIDAIKKVIEQAKTIPTVETFVLGEEDVLSYQEIQNIVGRHIHQSTWPLVRVPVWVAKFGAKILNYMPFVRPPFIRPWMVSHADEHFDVDIIRFKRTFNWSPQRNLRDKLPTILSHLQKDPSKWYKINKIAPPFYRSLDGINGPGEKNLFIAFCFNIFLGLWLIMTPFTVGALERAELWSEFVSGVLIIIFATLSLVPTLIWFRWPMALTGLWLMFSPLIIETIHPGAYINDTLIGALIMLTSLYMPSLPQKSFEQGVPPGWSYNPSTVGQRLPIMFLAFLGFAFSRYLAAFQLGHIQDIWDPIFGDGTQRVLLSEVSQAFPISDAGLGAVTYLLDLVAAAIGGPQRWRTLPWAVVLFGFMIIPAGVTSIVLVMLQPISVGAWCTVCLLTAFIMLLMVPPAVDEVLASIQFLRRQRAQGKSFWKTFFLGEEEEKIEQPQFETPSQGLSWHLVLAAIISLLPMFMPWVFGFEGIGAVNLYITGALLTTFAVIACSEVARPVRLINVALGFWLMISPWIFGTETTWQFWAEILVGFVLCGLSLPLGRVGKHYGSFDKIVRWSPFKGHKQNLDQTS